MDKTNNPQPNNRRAYDMMEFPLMVIVIGLPMWFILTLLIREPAVAAIIAGLTMFVMAAKGIFF